MTNYRNFRGLPYTHATAVRAVDKKATKNFTFLVEMQSESGEPKTRSNLPSPSAIRGTQKNQKNPAGTWACWDEA